MMNSQDDASSPSAVEKFEQFELLSLEASPYSRRVKWALHLLNIEYKSSGHEPMSGELRLRWRTGTWKLWERVTVPVGFVTYPKEMARSDLLLEDGFTIVEWADDAMASSSATTRMVPPASRQEVFDYCNIAEEITDFGRGVFLQATREDPTILREFLGEGGPPDMALPIIAWVMATFFKIKYRSTFQTGLAEIRQMLQDLETTIVTKKKKYPNKDMVYLVGETLTLADLYVCVSVCDGPTMKPSGDAALRSKRKEEIMSRLSYDMKKDYPVLYSWAVGISEKHGVPAEDIW